MVGQIRFRTHLHNFATKEPVKGDIDPRVQLKITLSMTPEEIAELSLMTGAEIEVQLTKLQQTMDDAIRSKNKGQVVPINQSSLDTLHGDSSPENSEDAQSDDWPDDSPDSGAETPSGADLAETYEAGPDFPEGDDSGPPRSLYSDPDSDQEAEAIMNNGAKVGRHRKAAAH